MSPSDLDWLTGLLEGEGSFGKGPPSKPNAIWVRIEMTDEDVIARVAGLFGLAYSRRKPKNPRHKMSFTVLLRGSRAASLMIKLRPSLGIRRRSQIDEALASYKPDEGRLARRSRTLPDAQTIRRMHETSSIRMIAKQIGCHPSWVGRQLKHVS